MGNASMWNPWLKPAHEGYIKPSDIEKLNAKIDKPAAERRKRLIELEETKLQRNQEWDALEDLLTPRGVCYE